MAKWVHLLDKFGAAGSVVGSIFATLCCLGFAPLVAFLSAIGVGFLINDVVLLPFLIVFLVIGGIGLWRTARRAGTFKAVWLHGISAVILVVSIFVFYQLVLVWLSLGGIIGASVWSFFIQKACHAGACKT